jgi:hypothetical protein
MRDTNQMMKVSSLVLVLVLFGFSLDSELIVGSVGLVFTLDRGVDVIRLIDCRQISSEHASSASGLLTSLLALLALGSTTFLLGRNVAILDLLLLCRTFARRRLLGRLAVLINGLGSPLPPWGSHLFGWR